MSAHPDSVAADVGSDAARVPGSPARPRRRRPPVLLAASVTACWAAVVSCVPVVAIVALAALVGGARPPAGQIARLGVTAWLLAHGVSLSTPAGPVGLAPLALSVVAAWRVGRAGVHTTRAIGGRRRPRKRASEARAGELQRGGRPAPRAAPQPALLAAGAVAGVYGILGALAAVYATGPDLRVSVVGAGLTFALFGLACAGFGAFAESGVLRWLTWRAPDLARDATRTGAVAALLVVAAGAAVTGVALAVASGDAAEMVRAYHAGVAGQAGLILVCLVYAPNLAIWAAAYLVGPGFAVGTGTIVSAGAVRLGALPALPALAALPSRPASSWGAALLGVPLAAGMTSGWLLARRRLHGRRDDPAASVDDASWWRMLAAAALTGPVAGLLLGLAGLISSGPLGSGRLAVLGPRVGLVVVVAAGVVGVGAVLAAAATRGLAGARRGG